MTHLPQDELLVKKFVFTWIGLIAIIIFIVVMLMSLSIEWGKKDILNKAARGIMVGNIPDKFVGEMEAQGYYCPNKKSNPRIWLKR